MRENGAMAKELMSMLTDPLFWALLAGVFAAFALTVRSQIRRLRREQAAERERRERYLNHQVKLAALAWMAEAAREREAIKRDVRAWRALADRATQTDARS